GRLRDGRGGKQALDRGGIEPAARDQEVDARTEAGRRSFSIRSRREGSQILMRHQPLPEREPQDAFLCARVHQPSVAPIIWPRAERIGVIPRTTLCQPPTDVTKAFVFHTARAPGGAANRLFGGRALAVQLLHFRGAMRAASRLGLLVLASGCVEHFAMPMTASQLAQSPSGAALVAYLGQPDASATVCDLDAAGAHLTIADQDVRAALVDGLAAGRVEPPIWRSCVDAMLRPADRESAASLLDAIGRSYRKLLADSHFERDPAMQARVAAMHEVYLERTNGVAPHDRVMSELLADLRQALDKRRLGPIAVRYGADLLATVDLERGNLRGRPVDVAVLDQLLAAGDEGQLRRCGQRLPDPGLRTEARRRVVRLHIQASPYPEVHENAAAVEQAVLKTGSNRISAAEHRPLRGWIDAARLTVRGVLLRQ